MTAARQPDGRGAHLRKLRPDQVRRIRVRNDPTYDQYFAHIFGVSKMTVNLARRRKIWRKLV